MTTLFQSMSDLDLSLAEKSFDEHGVVVLKNLLKNDVGIALRSVVGKTLETHGSRRDFLMPQTNCSPRRMTIVNGRDTADVTLIRSIYRSSETIRVLSRISRSPVTLCPDGLEDVIITELDESGDTHGWHLDDYPLALILIVEASNLDKGGAVQYVDPDGEIVSMRLCQGDAYLMRTDRCMHRVSPLEMGAGRRRIVNLTYSIVGQKVAANGTAQKLLS